MQRRDFIRVLGGSTIAAAALPLAGCSAEYPPAAVAAWRGPGDEPELRRRVLSYAILAPNPHNLQSWLIDLREPDAITLWVDPQRLLPETDPPGRQILIGQGAFLELLVLALAQQGFEAQVTVFPGGEPGPRCDDLPARPVARVSYRPGGRADPLFAQALRRHTPKSDYDTRRAVAADELEKLRDAAGGDAAGFGGTVDMSRVETLRALCWDAAKIELLTPRTMMESVRLTRVGPSEIAQHRDGISVNNAMARVAAAFGLFDRSAPPAVGSTAYTQVMARFEGHSRTAMGFVWLATAGSTRRQQLDAGRAFLRLQLKATELGLAVHPMSQALQEFPEMAAPYARAHQLVLGVPAPRSAADPTVQMLCRIGYPTLVASATPRRDLSACVRTS